MQDRIGAMRRALLCVVLGATLLAVLSVSGWSAGCSTCGAIKGIEIDDKLGTVCVVPVVAGIDIGLGAPYRLDKNNMPGEGNIRYYVPPSPGVPYIKWGNSRFTFNGSNVLIDGVQRPGWNWNNTSKKLTAPDGSYYQFKPSDPNIGVLTSSSGASGIGVTTYSYASDRISSVTDRYGNQWTYGVDAGSFGPTYVINPDGTRKVGFTYKAIGVNGTGQYDVVTVYKKSGSSWVEQEHTNYTYDAGNRVTQVSNVTVTDTSTTNITYSGDYVSRVENSQLKHDMTYEYSTEDITTSGGTYPYGVVTIRHRSTYGQDTNSSDQRTKFCYYLDATAKNRYLFRQVSQVFDVTNWSDYATTEYRRYGYNDRFTDTDKPTSDLATLQGQAWKIVDPRGNATKYAYSSTNGMVTTTTLPTNDYTQTWYKQISSQDSAFVEKVRDARGKYTRYTRDNTYPSLITKVEVSDNDSTYTTIQEMSYYSTPTQKQGLLYQETIPDIEGTDDKVTTYDYQETIGSTVHYRPSPTTVSYSWYNPATSSYETKTSTKSYYKDGRVHFTKDALGNQTDFSYDAMLRLTQMWLPADSGDSGSVSSNSSTVVTDTTKSWLQDQLAGMALQVTSGAYSGNIYPIIGNTATTITISGSLPSLTGASYAVRPFTESHYLACCNLADWEQDARGKKTYNTYDSDRRILTEVRNDVTGSNSTNPLVKYTYNDLGQKTEERTYKDSSDTTGRLTSYAYDQLGRVTKMIYPDNGGTRLLWNDYFQYDLNNKLVAKLVGVVDGSGNITAGSVTAYEYDSLNRLTKIKYNYSASAWPIASISISSENISYQYDGGSSLKTQMVDSSGTSSYTYNTRGQLAMYTPPLPANYRVDYSYDALGAKTSVVIEYNNGGWANQYKTAYAYFKNGWLKQVKGQKWVSGAWSDMTRSDFAYDAAGNRSERKNNDVSDVDTTYVSNARGETKSITHNKSGDLYKLVYTRDGLGNPLQAAFSGMSFSEPYPNANKVRYSYDDTGRLTNQDWGYGDWTSANSTTWNYDWVGNRNPSSNIYNQADMLNKDNGYKYDYLGNTEYVPNDTASTRTRYYYNDDNLLSQVDDVANGNTVSTFITWDADWQRVKVMRGSDTWEVIPDTAAWVTHAAPATLLARNCVNLSTTCTFYVREPNGDLLSSFDDAAISNKYYYHFDDLGSTVLVTDGSGSVSDGFTYGAWGYVLSSIEGNCKPYHYVGQFGYNTYASGQGTALSGLIGLGVRFYDPEIGRFTQKDPAGFVGGLNFYEYVKGLPTSEIDPSGLCLTAFERCMLEADNTYNNAMAKAYLAYGDCIYGAAKYPPPLSIILAYKCNADFTKAYGKANVQLIYIDKPLCFTL